MDAAEATRTFIAAWNVDGDDERLGMLEACCEANARFVSPQGDLAGLEAFSASVGGFRRAFPSATVVMEAPDWHHGFARLRWERAGTMAEPLASARTSSCSARKAGFSSSSRSIASRACRLNE